MRGFKLASVRSRFAQRAEEWESTWEERVSPSLARRLPLYAMPEPPLREIAAGQGVSVGTVYQAARFIQSL